MSDFFIQQINSKNLKPLSPDEEELIKSRLTVKKLRKKQFFLFQGDVCRHLAFVEKGGLRSFTINEKENENIIQFAFEGWLIADLHSYLTGEPASFNIQAIETSELMLLTRKDRDELIEQVPGLQHYFFLLIQSAYVALQQRLAGNISLSVEANYLSLIEKYPDIINRVPQHMIASYLGITPETLSRVRKQLASN